MSMSSTYSICLHWLCGHRYTLCVFFFFFLVGWFVCFQWGAPPSMQKFLKRLSFQSLPVSETVTFRGLSNIKTCDCLVTLVFKFTAKKESSRRIPLCKNCTEIHFGWVDEIGIIFFGTYQSLPWRFTIVSIALCRIHAFWRNHACCEVEVWTELCLVGECFHLSPAIMKNRFSYSPSNSIRLYLSIRHLKVKWPTSFLY